MEKEIEQTENKIKELDNMLFQEEISSDFSKAQELFAEKTKVRTAFGRTLSKVGRIAVKEGILYVKYID